MKKFLLLGLFLTSAFLSSKAVVTVDSTSVQNICPGDPSYTNITDSIFIIEGAVTDFATSGATRTRIISMPAGFELNPGTGTVDFGVNFSGTGFTIAANQITINYILNVASGANTETDSIWISGLQVRADTGSVSGCLLISDGNTLMSGNDQGDAVCHAYFSSNGFNGTITPTHVTCAGGSNGQATVNLINGSGPFTYLWAPGGQTNGTITGLSAGQQIVFVNDGACVATDTVTITEPSAVTVTINPALTDSVTCNGGSDGDAGANNATGGTGPYTYQWNPGAIPGQNLNNVSAGSYNVQATDANGCLSNLAFVTVPEPAALNVSIVDTNHVSFFGGNDGNAKGAVTGGNGGYTYDWTPGTPSGDGTDSIHTLVAGNYYFVVTDYKGCKDSALAPITQPNPPLVPGSIGSNQQGCDSINPALFTSIAPASGDVGPYSYQWQSSTNLSVWNNILGATAATYNVPGFVTQTTYYRREVTSTYQGPVYTSPIVVTINPTPTVAFTGLDNQYCEYEKLDTLYGIPNAPPGTFTGPPGIYDYGNGKGAIDPDSIGWGTHNVTYTWTDPLTGCTGMYSQSVVVDSIPSVAGANAFNGLSSTYYVSDPRDTAFPNPAGGYYTGAGMGGTIFDPNIAGAGNHIIRYIYTDPSTGCIDTTTLVVTVVASGTAIGGLGVAHCETEGVKRLVTLTDPPANGTGYNGSIVRLGFDIRGVNGTPNPPGGVITNFNTPSGPDSCNLNILPIPPGDYQVRYRFTEQARQCFSFPFIGTICFPLPFSNTYVHAFQDFKVEAKPTSSVVGLSPLYCATGDSITLGGSPGGGVLSCSPGGFLFGNQFVTSTPGVYNFEYIYTAPGGVCVDTSYATTNVVALPNVSMTGQDSAQCIYDDTDTIIGIPAGGDFWSSASGFATSPIPAADTGYLDPSAAGAGTYKVAYTYTDINGCLNSDTQLVIINPRPIVNILPFQNQICKKADSILIVASPPLGNWNNPGLTPFGPTLDSAHFDPDAAPKGPNWIYYDFTDINGCFNIDSGFIQVDTLPDPGITNLDTAYCASNTFFDALGGTPLSTGNFVGGGIINGNEYHPFPSLIDTTTWVGLDTVVYIYTDPNTGCVGYDTAGVRIYPNPIPDFSILNFCVTDSIQYADSSTHFNNDTIASWFWSLDNNLFDTIQNPLVWYNGVPGQKTISLTVTTEFGCQSTITHVDTFGLPSTAKFTWSSLCFGDTVSFTDGSLQPGQILSWNWDFGDTNTSVIQSPSHLYSDTGSYTVRLSVLTNRGCVDSLTKVIIVRPLITQYPYYIDFENGNGGWASNDLLNQDLLNQNKSWQMGVPSSPVINSAASGNIAWGTNLGGDHLASEASYVDGPCFDLSSLNKPMIKFNSLTHSQAGADGAVLQYNLNNDTIWHTIGTNANTGLEWYNSIGLNGNPGNQSIKQYGWSGHSPDSSWVSSRHKLDSVRGQTNVRFRIAFGADQATQDEGFAFDDVWIGERNKILLVEQFTNSFDATSAAVDSTIYRLQNENRLDVVDIHYHTSLGGSDPMNANNNIEPSARRTYYTVNSNAWSVLDGNYLNSSSFLVNQNIIDLRILEDNLFDVSTTSSINGGILDITTIVKANANFSGLDISCHNVIVEDSVSIAGANGQNMWQGVLQKMMPNAAGTKLQTNWTIGDVDTIRVSWPISNVYNLTNDQLEVVAFVQNNTSKEVYQAANDDTTTALVGKPEPLGAPQPIEFIVFPNPTQGKFTVAMNQFATTNGAIRIFDQIGNLVRQETIPYGRGEVDIDLSNMAQGVYLVNVSNGEQAKTKRLVIIH